MSDTLELEQPVIEKQAETKPEIKIASSGPVQRGTFPQPQKQEEIKIEEKQEGGEAGEIKTPEQLAAEKEIADKAALENKLELTDEELREIYNKRFPTQEQQTEEQKQAAEKAYEKKMLDLYLDGGGTIESFTKLKELTTMDLAALSKTAIIATLNKEGITDEKTINEILVERYYQINPDELEQDDEETDEEFTERKAKIAQKVAIGKTSFERKGTKLKEQADNILNTLKTRLSEKDSEAKEEADFIAKVEELPKTLPTKLTLQLGKLNDKDLGSVDIDVSDSEKAEIVSVLKDPAQRKQLLFNEDDSLNETAVANLLLRNKLLEKALREGYLTGQTKQVELVEKIFPNRSPNAIGVGGAPQNVSAEKGKVAGFGKAERVRK